MEAHTKRSRVEGAGSQACDGRVSVIRPSTDFRSCCCAPTTAACMSLLLRSASVRQADRCAASHKLGCAASHGSACNTPCAGQQSSKEVDEAERMYRRRVLNHYEAEGLHTTKFRFGAAPVREVDSNFSYVTRQVQSVIFAQNKMSMLSGSACKP